jgi:hypothetical protein
MNEQEIIKQLLSLKNIEPDSNWSARNRDILHSQIFGGSAGSKDENRKLSGFSVFFNYAFSHVAAKLAQPTWMAISIILFFTMAIGGSVYASRNTKPGDSLYIAKVISEKAHFAVTFNEKEKAKLGMTFAGNRAKEITQVLAKETTDKTEQQEQVKQLETDFKKEISNVIIRLEKTNTAQKIAKSDQPKKDDGAESVKMDDKIAVKEAEIFGANLSKDSQRMEVSVPEKPKPAEPTKPEPKDSSVVPVSSVQSTSTLPQATSTAEIVPEEKSEVEKVLLDAEKLLIENKDIDGTLDKLDEAKVIMNFVEKEAGDGATSTSK